MHTPTITGQGVQLLTTQLTHTHITHQGKLLRAVKFGCSPQKTVTPLPDTPICSLMLEMSWEMNRQQILMWYIQTYSGTSQYTCLGPAQCPDHRGGLRGVNYTGTQKHVLNTYYRVFLHYRVSTFRGSAIFPLHSPWLDGSPSHSGPTYRPVPGTSYHTLLARGPCNTYSIQQSHAMMCSSHSHVMQSLNLTTYKKIPRIF